MTRTRAKLCAWLVGTAAALGATSAFAATLAEDADTVCKDSLAGPTPSGRITPANPAFCKVLGHIEPTDPKAPPVKFEVNLPVEWNGRSLHMVAAASTAC